MPNIALNNRRRLFAGTALFFSALLVAISVPLFAHESAKQESAKPAAPVAAAPCAAPVFVAMTTTKGTLYLELNAEKAPITVANFVAYAKDGYYNGTIFHRVIKSFMIQGGGHTADMAEKTHKAPIKNEWTNCLTNDRGAIAMARTNEPDSAAAQFFINTVDNKMLDVPRGGAAYAVFGKVVTGMDVVDAIAAVAVGQSKGMGDVPKETITITKVEVLSGPPAADAPTLLVPAAPAVPAPATSPTP
ncbi:MAG: peptidyl-prolyl cis-trans isomerase [Phycisphaerales bacterium]|nr:peptidyl-prolyl cis-trans isomerase [Phycisphaerales bacterium]